MYKVKCINDCYPNAENKPGYIVFKQGVIYSAKNAPYPSGFPIKIYGDVSGGEESLYFHISEENFDQYFVKLEEFATTPSCDLNVVKTDLQSLFNKEIKKITIEF